MNKLDSWNHVALATFAIAIGIPIIASHGVSAHAVIYAWGAFAYLVVGMAGVAFSGAAPTKEPTQ